MNRKIDTTDNFDLDRDLDTYGDRDRESDRDSERNRERHLDGDGERTPDTLRCAAPEVPPPPASGIRLRDDVPERTRMELHALVLAASQADRRAIGAIAIAFGPNLIALAQSEIDRPTAAEEEAAAAELVTELLEAMAQGALVHRPPDPGEGLEWIWRVVSSLARAWDTPELGGGPEEEEDEEARTRDDGSGDRWRRRE
jgi:hypothetical protein